MGNTIAAFFTIVCDDEKLRNELSSTENREEFIQRAIALAKERGYGFTCDELREALETAKALKEQFWNTQAA